MRKFILLPFLQLICLHGQAQDSCRIIPSKAYFTSYYSDSKAVVHEIGRIKPYQWAALGAAVIIAGANDRQFYSIAKQNQSQVSTNLSKYAFEPLGSGVYTIPTIAFFYSYGVAFHQEKSKQTALMAGESFILSAISVQVLKHIIHRERPYQAEQERTVNPFQLSGPFQDWDHTSFPSGHAIAVFSVATIFAKQYSSYKLVPYICYGLAGMTALSRIYDNKHWSSDVLVGALMGYGIAQVIYKNHATSGWHVGMNAYGIGLSYQFSKQNKKYIVEQ